MKKKKKNAKAIEERLSITVIRLKLLRPIGTTIEDFWKAINEAGYLCDIARNRMFRRWMRWREDNPAWKPDVVIDKGTGQPVVRKSGEVVYRNCPAPPQSSEEQPCDPDAVCRWCRVQKDENQAVVKARNAAVVGRMNPDGVFEPVCEKHRLVGFSTILNRHGRLEVPALSSSLMTILSNEVWDDLTAKARWLQGKMALYRWESYVMGEEQLPNNRGRNIPVPYSSLKIGWDDCCWVEFPLWSKDRDQTTYRVECKIRGLSPRLKEVLDMAIRGELKISDSYINDEHASNGADWELHLIVKTPAETSGLNPRRKLCLYANQGPSSRPFTIEIPGGDVFQVGSGIPLVKEHERLTLRRKAIRGAGRIGAMNGGHGERRVMRAVTSESRRYGGVQSAFYRDLADRVYAACIRNNCGTVVYSEPPVDARGNLWFAARDTPFDWTQQRARLIGKLVRRGIEVEIPDDTKKGSKPGHGKQKSPKSESDAVGAAT